MIKKLLRFIHMLGEVSTRIIVMVGFTIVAVFAVVSLAYLRGQLVMVEGGVSIDITELVTGKLAYIWVGLVSVWLIAKGLYYGLRFRNWWVHTDSRKIKLPVMSREATIR